MKDWIGVTYNDWFAFLSRQLMPLVEYSLDEDGCMNVHNDTAIWYRYIDMTPLAEVLFRFIDQTIYGREAWCDLFSFLSKENK